MTQQDILQALSHVQEPDLHKDLVTLNMIQDIQIDGNQVRFTIVLTTPACPLKEKMRMDCEKAIREKVNPDAVITVKFTANTTTNRLDGKALLSKVKNIIAVVSGKGGVGKSTVSANLALSLAQGGAKVGLMDADIYGPSVPIMFDVTDEKPAIKQINGKNMMIPVEAYGVKVLSIGFFAEAAQAVVWRGPMASKALQQMKVDCDLLIKSP